MINIRQFYQATNPARTLDPAKPRDSQFYIDFSGVRGEELIGDIKRLIVWSEVDTPTCTLFTGHIGCGKSTELLKLRQELEAEGFHVIYFESSDDLEMADVDIGDVLLAIARRISQSLESLDLGEMRGLRGFLQGAAKVLMTPIELEVEAELPVKVPNLDPFTASASTNGEFSISAGIGKITARAKNDATLRDRLNQFLGPQKNQLLQAINEDLLKPAITQLQQQGKAGLVVIVDNLDRIDNRPKAMGRSQQEYLFIDQHECLRKLHCHKVYTMPLALRFSMEYGALTSRYPDAPRVLPMVPVRRRTGDVHLEGMARLRQMVLARALPEATEADRLAQIPALFDPPESLDRLCLASGGHVRDLLKLLHGWIQKSGKLPLNQAQLENLIRARCNEMALQLADSDWVLLRQAHHKMDATTLNPQDYQHLIRGRLVFEYRDEHGSWFDVNPTLLESGYL